MTSARRRLGIIEIDSGRAHAEVTVPGENYRVYTPSGFLIRTREDVEEPVLRAWGAA